MNGMKCVLLAGGFLAAMASGGLAATFNTAVPANTVAASISGTAGGVGFTMTGFTVNDDLSNETAAQVGYDGSGFGVAGISGAVTVNPGGTPQTAGDFTIDGLGVDQNELLRITFDRHVTVNGFTFDFIDRLDDVFVRVDGSPVGRFGFGGDTSLNFGGLGALTSLPLEGKIFDIVAGFPNQVCAQNNPGGVCGGGNDLFQLTGANVSPIPVPAALPMLLSALGLTGWLARRRHAKA